MKPADFQTAAADLVPGAIAVLQGAATKDIQRLLQDLAARRIAEGIRVAGVVEVWDDEAKAPGDCHTLRDVATGSSFQIFQSLGSGSSACSLDASELASACAAVLKAIDEGADLVVLNKFGKLEAEGGGLLDCFRAAVAMGIPCATGVSPALTPVFLDFAGGFEQRVGARTEALERWWAERRKRACG
jgi:hypothetical protein